MAEPVRIVVAGVGLVGRRHVDAILKTPGAFLAAVVDPSDDARSYEGKVVGRNLCYFRMKRQAA